MGTIPGLEHIQIHKKTSEISYIFDLTSLFQPIYEKKKIGPKITDKFT